MRRLSLTCCRITLPVGERETDYEDLWREIKCVHEGVQKVIKYATEGVQKVIQYDLKAYIK